MLVSLKQYDIMAEIQIKNNAELRRVRMAAMLEQEIMHYAWRELSRRRPLTAAMLEYGKGLIWDEVSQNTEIEWSIETAKRCKDKINWHLFSRNAHGEVTTHAGIEALVDFWDWSELTANSNVEMTIEIAEKYVGRWDWAAMAWRDWEGRDAREFYIHFIERIPVAAFNGSKLHSALRRQEVDRLWNILSKEVENK